MLSPQALKKISRVGGSTVLDGAVLVAVEVEALLILVHGAEAHAHRRETAVVEKVLHGDLAGEVGEECDGVVGTLVSGGVAEG